MVRAEEMEEVADRAKADAEERVLDLLLPPRAGAGGDRRPGPRGEASAERRRRGRRGSGSARMLREGKLSDRTVDVEVREAAAADHRPGAHGGGMPEGMDGNLQEMLSSLLPKRTRRKKMRVPDALRHSRGRRRPRAGSTWTG